MEIGILFNISKWQKMHKMLLVCSKEDLPAKPVDEIESKEVGFRASKQALNTCGILKSRVESKFRLELSRNVFKLANTTLDMDLRRARCNVQLSAARINR